MDSWPRGCREGAIRLARWFRVPVACCALVLLLPAPGWAGGLGVIAADGSAVDAPMLDNVAEALQFPQGTVAPHDLGQPAGAWLTVAVEVDACVSPVEVDLAGVADDARTKLSQLESAEALEALEAAVGTAACSPSPVARADYLVALELLAQAAQDEGKVDRARAALQRLVAADASYRLSSPPGSGYDHLWTEVRRGAAQVEPVEVAIQHAGEVLLDGEPVPAAWTLTAPLLPGEHLLQWRLGGAWTGGQLTVPTDAEAGALIEPAAVRGLLDRGPADAGSRAALRTWLVFEATSAGLDGIAVVQDPRGLRGFVVEEGRTGSWNSLLAGGRSGQTKRAEPPPPGVPIGLGLAGGAAVLGGLSAWQFDTYGALQEELQGNIPSYEERQLKAAEATRAQAAGGVLLGGAIAAGTASAVSLIVSAVQARQTANKKSRGDRP